MTLTPRSLRRNFGATLVGNLVYTATQFVMLLALARFANVTEVGRYALALAITTPIFLLASLKLRQVQVTDAGGDNAPGDFFALRFLTSVAAIAASVLAVLVGGLPRESILTVAAVAAFKAIEAQIDTTYGVMQRLEQMQLIASAQVSRGLLGAVAFTAAAWWKETALAGSVALAVASIVPLLLNLRTVRRLDVPTHMAFDRSALTQLALLALPLGISIALGSLVINVPRYLLQYFDGASAVGVFAVIGYVLVATNTVAGALAQAASPRLANLYAVGNGGQFRRTLAKLNLFGVALGLTGLLVAAVAGRPLLQTLFGSEYAAEWRVLVVLMVAAALQYAALFVGTAVNALRLFKVQAPVTALALIAVLVTSWLLIPDHGLTGAAWAVVAAQVIQLWCYAGLYVLKVRPALARAT